MIIYGRNFFLDPELGASARDMKTGDLEMTRSRIFSISLLVLFCGFIYCFTCCNGQSTPKEQMDKADQAKQDGDYEKALELYNGFRSWKGEGEVSAADKLKASLESARCMIFLKRPQEAVDSFKKMFEQYPAEMKAPGAYKKTLTVLSTLIQEKTDEKISIDLLAFAKETYPEQEENWDKLAKRLIEQGVSDEGMEKLKTLGYL